MKVLLATVVVVAAVGVAPAVAQVAVPQDTIAPVAGSKAFTVFSPEAQENLRLAAARAAAGHDPKPPALRKVQDVMAEYEAALQNNPALWP